jgi:hypothetical protein
MKTTRFLILAIAALALFNACSDDNAPGTLNNNNNGGGNNAGGCAGGPTTVTDIDGNIYNVISIGNQCWMKENLKTAHYRNGTPIPTGLNDSLWQTTTSAAYTIYNDNSINDSLLGKLYNWYAVADSNGLCPIGWHVPSFNEWDTLINYLGGDAIAGGAMKEIGLTHWASPNIGATDSSNFTGFPGGYRSDIGTYMLINKSGQWWSSDQYTNLGSISYYLYYNHKDVTKDFNRKSYGFSVRCVRD